LDFKLITAYPWWFILFCIVFGLLMTALLYFRSKKTDFTTNMVWTLAIVRFLVTTLLAFLLLSPMIRTVKRSTVKPSIVIGIDNSSSITMNSDSIFYRTDFLKNIEELKEELNEDYDIQTYYFGDDIETMGNPDYADELTNIATLFTEVNTRFFNRNIGAVILASDGIYNTGADPLYEVRNSKYPVFTINMGDTTIRKDLRIQRVNHNKTAFKGNRFPIEITLQAIEISGERSIVRITEDDKTLFSQDITISTSNQVITVPALIDAKDAGLKRLKVSVDFIEDEINTSNNSREIFVEVKESRLKVAIITDSPHPDVAALERVFEKSNNYEADLYNADEFNKSPEAYNLIVLYQLPSVRNPFTIQIKNIISSKTPVFLVIGSQSNIQLINTLDLGLVLVNFKGSYNEALPILNSGFSLFLYTEQQKKLIESLPPLVSPFASYNVANSANIFTKQVIGSTATDMPLIMFNETMDRRIGIIAGEGIWKWRMFDYVQNATHANFDDLVGKMFQYLTAQTDKGKFRVDWNNFYAENENIEFGALLLNDSYEPITEPEVTLQITDSQKRKFNYTFSAGEMRYSLRVGNFAPGVYSFLASANVSGEELVKRGSFVVTDVKLEDVNLVANHRLLNTIASESGGKSYSPKNFSALVDVIKQNESVKPIVYSRRNYMDLIDYYPLMIIIFLLLGVEWFLRKFWGSY
jgi:hypothetical protein